MAHPCCSGFKFSQMMSILNLCCSNFFLQFMLVTYKSRVEIQPIFQSGTTLETQFTSLYKIGHRLVNVTSPSKYLGSFVDVPHQIENKYFRGPAFRHPGNALAESSALIAAWTLAVGSWWTTSQTKRTGTSSLTTDGLARR